MQLSDFLLARLAEDEAVARGAIEARRAESLAARSAFGVAYMVVGGASDPARVLAEVEAKRLIVEEHAPQAVGYCCPTCWIGTEDGYPADSPCDTLRHLASVYSDHPDYSPDWRPD